MRNPDAAPIAAKASVAALDRDKRSVELVCAGLVLALLALAFRIASLW
jgi:hypothetical protein